MFYVKIETDNDWIESSVHEDLIEAIEKCDFECWYHQSNTQVVEICDTTKISIVVHEAFHRIYTNFDLQSGLMIKPDWRSSGF